ncbi:MAG: hypothetical protein ACLUTU_19880 [Blautia faecis]
MTSLCWIWRRTFVSAIRYSADPLRAALIYARTGNYIDFAALPEVSKETALSLIKSENKDELDEQEYQAISART